MPLAERVVRLPRGPASTAGQAASIPQLRQRSLHPPRARQPRDVWPWRRRYHGDLDGLSPGPGAFHLPLIENDGITNAVERCRRPSGATAPPCWMGQHLEREALTKSVKRDQPWPAKRPARVGADEASRISRERPRHASAHAHPRRASSEAHGQVRGHARCHVLPQRAASREDHDRSLSCRVARTRLMPSLERPRPER